MNTTTPTDVDADREQHDPSAISGHCIMRATTAPPQPPPGQPGDRDRLIRVIASKWVNGTVLHYYFVDGPQDQRQVVREAFVTWKELGLGLVFTEVQAASEAEIRIGFDHTDGSWSYVGRDVLNIPVNSRTMNFGWDLTSPYGRTTALHEIGHTLGMPHEHQNPFAGIAWNEDAVYAYFTGAPNNWSREQTFHNVLRQLSTTEVEGSSWDPDSVMEYWFPAGLITAPAQYGTGLFPPGGLSATDREWAATFYPDTDDELPPLRPSQSVALTLAPAEQADFSVQVTASRSYTFSTYGTSDTVMVLFEKVGDELRFVTGDDDSGQGRNSRFRVKLFAGREYVLRLRLYWAAASGGTTVMFF